MSTGPVASVYVEPVADPDQYVRLERAVLCADCDAVYNMLRDKCPSCGGGSALALGLVLDSERNKELVEALRALSRLLAMAKRPIRPRKEKTP